jgi:hypothetical protein
MGWMRWRRRRQERQDRAAAACDDGAYRISDLDWVARFEACKDPHFNHGISQYDGGIVVAQHRCFTLDFYIKGRPGRILRRVPATGDCRAYR